MIDPAKCKSLEALHLGTEAFVIPNPWDAGSARVLQGLGYKAIATTSSGLAYTLGMSDGNIQLEDCLAHCTLLARATTIPINCDFEDGFAATAEDVAENVVQLAATGVAGCSIEDWNRQDKVLYTIDEAVARVSAAVSAAASLGAPFQITARAENLLHDVIDLDDTITRLQAFEAAGAHVLYAPGIRTLEDLRTVTGSLGRPFNALATLLPGVTVVDLFNAGAHRVSVGGALAWVSVAAFQQAAEAMLTDGSFEWTKLAGGAGKARTFLD